MSEMVDRIARRLAQRSGFMRVGEDKPEGVDTLVGGNPFWHRFRPDAQSALDEMREPTPQMIEAGFDLPDHPERPDLARCYCAMIDAALKEPA